MMRSLPHLTPLPSVLLVLAATVSRGDAQRPASTVVDSAGVQIVASDPRGSDTYCALSDEPALRLGVVEGEEPYMFYWVRGANRLSDGSVAVMNNGSGEIRVFGADGRHLRSMGGKGEGPGEFKIGRYIWVLPGDTLWVGDYRPWRYHVYVASGKHVRTVDMKPQYFNASVGGGVLDDGTSVNVRILYEQQEPNFQVPEPWFAEAHAADGAVIEGLARLEANRNGTWDGAGVRISVLFDPRPSVHARVATIAIATAREPEVRLLDEQRRLRRIVRWEDSDREVNRAHVQAYREDVIERRGGRDSEDWHPVDDVRISDRRPVADAFPTVESVQVGRDGRVWVSPYRKPGTEEAAKEWWAFGTGGEFQCRLDHPAGVTIYEFGADYLLGVHIDELEVERVVMYELRWPEAGAG